jgi:excisionase family DNA binding protein
MSITVTFAEKEYYSIKEVASLLGKSTQTVYQWQKTGKFRTVRIKGKAMLDLATVKALVAEFRQREEGPVEGEAEKSKQVGKRIDPYAFLD